MLKQLLQKQPQQDVNISDYILSFAENIQNKYEKNILLNVIYHNKPRVKFMPFDYNWGIYPNFKQVSDAIIKLTGIIVSLNTYKWTDPDCLYLKNHLTYLYNILKDGLIAYGCSNPPEVKNISTTQDTIIEIAEQILKI